MNFRPITRDIALCTNKLCKNKCKRFYENWQPSDIQTYVNPIINFDKHGNMKKCKIRLD